MTLSADLKKQLFLIGSLLVCLILYWPSFQGEPLFDDVPLWFIDPAMRPDMGYLHIWQNYSWPMNVTIQKVFLSIWGYNFETYHVINLFVHMLNSLILFHIGEKLNWPKYGWLFLLYLFHPANVITVNWMIQIKTLCCFLFALLSFLSFHNGIKSRVWMPLAWFLFLLSVLTKSASIPLGAVFLIYGACNLKGRRILWAVPFILISLFATHRLLSSEFTKEVSNAVYKKSENLSEKKQETFKIAKLEEKLIQEIKVTNTKKEDKRAGEDSSKELAKFEKLEIPKSDISDSNVDPQFPRLWKANPVLILNTMKYYFWQSFVPLKNQPVKNIRNELNASDLIHLVFLLFLIWWFRKSYIALYLVSAYIALSPFLGIVPAPYMNITWISDQHLYLVIPFFLVFFLHVLEFNLKLPQKYIHIPPAIFLSFFIYKSVEAMPYYKTNISFYQSVIEEDPSNVAIVYNLAINYMMRGDNTKALKILDDGLKYSETSALMRSNKYFPVLNQLKQRIIMAEELHKKKR